MRICITLTDQSFTKTTSLGIYYVSVGLCQGLAAAEGVSELIIMTNGEFDNVIEEIRNANPDRVKIKRIHQSAPSGWRRVIWDQRECVTHANRTRADWVLFPKGFPPLIRWPRARVCCYVHDNIFGYYKHQGWGELGLAKRIYFLAALKRASSRADLVATNSRFTLSEVRELGRRRPSACVGIGFDREPQRPDKSTVTGLPDRIEDGLLVLVSPLPHKLTRQAVEWIQRWKARSGSGISVFGVGRLPDGMQWPDENNSWRLFPRLDAAAFEAIWDHTAAILYFSAYEGFGLPPIEASRRGIRFLASDVPPHREHFPSSLLFNNNSFEDFAENLDILLGQPTEEVFRPAVPSWDTVASRLVQELRDIGNKRTW